MQAADINWRPLGELFVEQGLISEEELEGALVAQGETHGRLGEILVSRGLVSERELTRVLVDQLGRELEQDGVRSLRAFDSGQRESARAEQRTVAAPPLADRGDPAGNGDLSGSDSIRAPSAFEAALAKEREDLEAALNERRAALKAALAEASPAAQPDVPVAPRDETHHAEEVERTLREQTEALNVRLAALEASFADERTRHRQSLVELEHERATHRRVLQEIEHERATHSRVLQELDQARSQARVETTELRSSLERLRKELTRLDETTSWFEYWSGSSPPTSATAEGTSAGT
jgi:hypothetical protein